VVCGVCAIPEEAGAPIGAHAHWHEHLHRFIWPQDECDTPSTVMKLFEMSAKPNKGLIDRNAVTMMQSQ